MLIRGFILKISLKIRVLPQKYVIFKFSLELRRVSIQCVALINFFSVPNLLALFFLVPDSQWQCHCPTSNRRLVIIEQRTRAWPAIKNV